MKYVDKLLVECILIPLGLTAVALAADAGIKKNSDLKQWNNNFKRRNGIYHENTLKRVS